MLINQGHRYLPQLYKDTPLSIHATQLPALPMQSAKSALKGKGKLSILYGVIPYSPLLLTVNAEVPKFRPYSHAVAPKGSFKG